MLKPRPDIQDFSRVLFTAQSLVLVSIEGASLLPTINLRFELSFWLLIFNKHDGSDAFVSDGASVDVYRFALTRDGFDGGVGE